MEIPNERMKECGILDFMIDKPIYILTVLPVFSYNICFRMLL